METPKLALYRRTSLLKQTSFDYPMLYCNSWSDWRVCDGTQGLSIDELRQCIREWEETNMARLYWSCDNTRCHIDGPMGRIEYRIASYGKRKDDCQNVN